MANVSRTITKCRPQPWESDLLRLIAEQGAIPFDQLARFLGCAQEQATRVAKHLTQVGHADYGRILADEPYWVWITARGSRVSGADLAAGPPRVGAMARMRAVNEVRLHIAARAPEARWISGRTVFREQGKRGWRPNAVVEIADERHAMVVRQGQPKNPEHEVPAFQTHMRRYDAVICFANRRSLPALKRLQGEHHWPKLILRPIPDPPKTRTDSPRHTS